MFLKAALCEDNSSDRSAILRVFSEWEIKNGHTFQISEFPSSEKLLAEIADDFTKFDIYLLDIEMEEPKSGFALAEQIRLRSYTAPIVFITNHIDLSFSGHQIRALHFIRKPLRESDVDELTKRIRLQNPDSQEEYFTFAGINSVTLFPIQKIGYLEARGNYIHINGISGEKYRIRMRLSEAAKIYSKHFFVCHKSYAVNIKHLKTLRGARIILIDDTEIPVSRSNLKKVQEIFHDLHKILM